MKQGWIGVDFDGTLCTYDEWGGLTEFGRPVPAMVDRVKRWVAAGYKVKIMTARVSLLEEDELAVVGKAITDWCMEHLGFALDVTCIKDFNMIELWDDRAVTVEPNTGGQLSPSRRGLE